MYARCTLDVQGTGRQRRVNGQLRRLDIHDRRARAERNARRGREVQLRIGGSYVDRTPKLQAALDLALYDRDERQTDGATRKLAAQRVRVFTRALRRLKESRA